MMWWLPSRALLVLLTAQIPRRGSSLARPLLRRELARCIGGGAVGFLGVAATPAAATGSPSSLWTAALPPPPPDDGRSMESLGVFDGLLSDCPETSTCVSSQDDNARGGASFAEVTSPSCSARRNVETTTTRVTSLTQVGLCRAQWSNETKRNETQCNAT
jgi:hypothetical protein